MLKNKIQQIFGESINKINHMVRHLDKQLGYQTLARFSTDINTDINNNINNNISKIEAPKNTDISSEKKEKTKKVESNNKDNSNNKAELAKGAKANTQAAKKEAKLFDEIDLRVGKVCEIKNLENSDSCYLLKIDVGEKEPREIGTGLRQFLKEDSFIDKKLIIFSNLKPKKLGSAVSNGMVLCSSNSDNTKFELLRPHEDAVPGDSVFIEGGEPLKEPLSKLSDGKFKKIPGKFKTDDNCFVVFEGEKLVTSKGPVTVVSLANSIVS